MDALIKQLAEIRDSNRAPMEIVDACEDAAKLLRECQTAMASFVETEGNGGGEVERHVAWFKELLA